MKKHILIALFLGFSFPAFLQTAKAQSFDKFQTEIPFEFSIGDDTFEAGKYTILKIKGSSEPQLFQLVDKNNQTLAIFGTRSNDRADAKGQSGVSLIFKRRGDGNILAEIRDSPNTFRLEKTQKPLETAKQKKRCAEDSTLVSTNFDNDR